ncbi:MAG: DUF1624 domain-containing protein [Cyclobacteriaceae bacterium]|nr:DUF1624 domain-containing protein [Cyclobacteriaceae bacterium]
MTTTLPTTHPRISSIDILRGIIMIIMALDHVREFYSRSAIRPEDLTQASEMLFMTRWITHFCAPVFIFLSGMSMRLYEGNKTKREVSIFLLKRGAWLMFLEITVINFLWNFGYDFILLEVIWVIGWSMICLAGLIWLPRMALLVVVVAIIAFHNLVPDVTPVTTGNMFWASLHNSPFVVKFESIPIMIVAYSLVPWVALMAAGYWMGEWYHYEEGRRNKLLRLTGVALIVIFIVMRLINQYGDPFPWAQQPRGFMFSVLSFINVTKKPPSLFFILLMMGPALFLLSVADHIKGFARKFAMAFGQVPLFFFVVHIFFISVTSWVWVHFTLSEQVNIAFASAKQFPADYTPSLIRTYVVWVLVLIVLYFPCKWYADYKRKNKSWWLSYL